MRASGVPTNDPESIDAECHNQKVLDGKEDQHLVNNFEVDHDGQTDQQKRAVLNQEGFDHRPEVSPVSRQKRASLRLVLLPFRV